MDANSVYPVDVGLTVLGEVWATKAVRTRTDNLEVGARKVQIIAHGERALQVGCSATRLAWTRPR
jgi:hypothetical protein